MGLDSNDPHLASTDEQSGEPEQGQHTSINHSGPVQNGEPAIPIIDQGFIPLKIIVERMVETAYIELKNLTRAYAKLARTGLIHSRLPNMSNTPRKRAMLEYLISTRQQLIKLLVLVRWTSVADQVHKCINIVAWFQGKKSYFQNLIRELQEVRQQLSLSQVRAADLVTAIDVLKNGTLARLEKTTSFSKYDTNTALTPSKTLKTLRKLNRLISLRLLLHETIPAPLVHYKVHSGRVTFRVKGKFRFDLAFAENDISKVEGFQWFLVAFELDLNDGTRLTESTVREIELASNECLAKALSESKPQLKELYRMLSMAAAAKLAPILIFLDSLYLNFRLNMHMRRAEILFKGGFSIQTNYVFKPESNSLRIHYWPNRTIALGHKRIKPDTYLEISIKSDQKIPPSDQLQSSRRSHHDYDRSQLLFIWLKDGQTEELSSHQLLHDFDLAQMVENLAKAHSHSLVQSLYDSLSDEPVFQRNLHLISTDGDGTQAVKLQISPRQTIIISISLSSGQFVLSDESQVKQENPLIGQTQRILRSESTDTVQALKRLRTLLIKHNLESKARARDYQIANMHSRFVDATDLQHHLDTANLHDFSFLLRSHWSRQFGENYNQWFIAFQVRESQLQWWLLEMTTSLKLADLVSWNILHAEKISGPSGKELFTGSLGVTPSRDEFEIFENLADIRRLFEDLQVGLKENGVSYRFVTPAETHFQGVLIPVLCIDTTGIAVNNLALHRNLFVRLRRSGEEWYFDVQGRLRDWSPHQRKEGRLRAEKGPFVIDPLSGRFVICVQTANGFTEIMDKLRALNAVTSLVRRPSITGVTYQESGSPYGVKFAFENDPSAWVEIVPSFHAETSNAYDVSFSSGLSVIYRRVHPFLQALLSLTSGSLRPFVAALQQTRPLLQVFDAIESQNSGTTHVVARSLTEYRLMYDVGSACYGLHIGIQRGEVSNGRHKPEVRYQISDASQLTPSSGLSILSLFYNIASEGLDLDDDELNGVIIPNEKGLTVVDDRMIYPVIERLNQRILNTVSSTVIS